MRLPISSSKRLGHWRRQDADLLYCYYHASSLRFLQRVLEGCESEAFRNADIAICSCRSLRRRLPSPWSSASQPVLHWQDCSIAGAHYHNKGLEQSLATSARTGRRTPAVSRHGSFVLRLGQLAWTWFDLLSRTTHGACGTKLQQQHGLARACRPRIKPLCN